MGVWMYGQRLMDDNVVPGLMEANSFRYNAVART